MGAVAVAWGGMKRGRWASQVVLERLPDAHPLTRKFPHDRLSCPGTTSQRRTASSPAEVGGGGSALATRETGIPAMCRSWRWGRKGRWMRRWMPMKRMARCACLGSGGRPAPRRTMVTLLRSQSQGRAWGRWGWRVFLSDAPGAVFDLSDTPRSTCPEAEAWIPREGAEQVLG